MTDYWDGSHIKRGELYFTANKVLNFDFDSQTHVLNGFVKASMKPHKYKCSVCLICLPIIIDFTCLLFVLFNK